MNLQDNYLLLLKKLDDSQNLEFPGGWNESDYNLIDKKITKLANEIRSTFLNWDVTIDSGSTIQDASFHGEIILHEKKDMTQKPIGIRISNFGSLAAFHLQGKPIDEEKKIEPLIPLLDKIELTYIPSKTLMKPYEGVHSQFKNWWERYFGWV